MNRAAALELVASADSATLGTLRPEGGVHLVPIVYALHRRQVVTAVDHKPKRTRRLQRLTNIAADPRVSVLVDHYERDWNRLWWVRIDGRAELVPTDDARHPVMVGPLMAKYPQYAKTALGTAIVISIERVVGWSASDA